MKVTDLQNSIEENMENGNIIDNKLNIPVNIQVISNSTINTSSNIPSTTKICNYIVVVLGILFILGLVAGSISFIVYTIIGLCDLSFKEQKKQCSNSNLWVYVLVNLIVTSMISMSVTKTEKKLKSISILESLLSFIIQILISLGFTVWGCYEFFGVNCIDTLNDTILYKILEINVVLGIIFNSCIILILSVFLCIKS